MKSLKKRFANVLRKKETASTKPIKTIEALFASIEETYSINKIAYVTGALLADWIERQKLIKTIYRVAPSLASEYEVCNSRYHIELRELVLHRSTPAIECFLANSADEVRWLSERVRAAVAATDVAPPAAAVDVAPPAVAPPIATDIIEDVHTELRRHEVSIFTQVPEMVQQETAKIADALRTMIRAELKEISGHRLPFEVSLDEENKYQAELLARIRAVQPVPLSILGKYDALRQKYDNNLAFLMSSIKVSIEELHVEWFILDKEVRFLLGEAQVDVMESAVI